MLHDYLSPETCDFVTNQIAHDVMDLFPNPQQLSYEIEHSSDFMDLRLQINSFIQSGAIYQNAWQLRQWMPASFSCFTDVFVWQVYKEIANNVIYNYIKFPYHD